MQLVSLLLVSTTFSLAFSSTLPQAEVGSIEAVITAIITQRQEGGPTSQTQWPTSEWAIKPSGWSASEATTTVPFIPATHTSVPVAQDTTSAPANPSASKDPSKALGPDLKGAITGVKWWVWCIVALSIVLILGIIGFCLRLRNRGGGKGNYQPAVEEEPPVEPPS